MERPAAAQGLGAAPLQANAQGSGIADIGNASQLERAATQLGVAGGCGPEAPPGGWVVQLAQARYNYFAAQGRAAAHTHAEAVADAEVHFAALLAAKDLHLLCLHLAAPSPPDWLAQARAESGSLLGDGPIDGGVAATARPAFDRWAGAVHHALDRMAPVSARTIPARAAHPTAPLATVLSLPPIRSTYIAYKLERDRAEHTRLKVHLAVERARASPLGLPLAAPEVARFEPARDTRHALLRGHPELHRQVVRLARRGATVLRCTYGPADTWPDGTPRWEEHRFWHRRAPAGLAALIQLDHEGALGPLRTTAARDACPATDRAPPSRREAGRAALPLMPSGMQE